MRGPISKGAMEGDEETVDWKKAHTHTITGFEGDA